MFKTLEEELEYEEFCLLCNQDRIRALKRRIIEERQNGLK